MARLDILEGLHAGISFSVVDAVSLGRAPSNTICLPEIRVSRQHARIFQCRERFVIEDLGSSNGTTVQGHYIRPHTPCHLRDGDQICVGSTRLVFYTKEASLIEIVEDHAAQPQVTATLEASQCTMPFLSNTHATDENLPHALKCVQVMSQVSSALSSVSDQEELLEKIMQCIFDAFPQAKHTLIMSKEEDGDDLVPVVARGCENPPAPCQEITFSRTIVKEVVTHKRALLSLDTKNDDRFKQQESILKLSILSMMCAPLLVRGEILGLIQVDTNTHINAFTPEDLHILIAISAQAAIGIKNLQLERTSNTLLQLADKSKRLEVARNKAVAANASKSDFLANTSHELRTPLHAILSFAGFGLKKAATAPPEKLHGYFEQIDQSGKVLLALVNDLLDLAKLEAGKMVFEFQPVDLSVILLAVSDEFNVICAERSLTIDCVRPHVNANVTLDAAKIMQVIRNLLSNAVKFSPQGGIIKIRTHVQETTVLATISDQGNGIPTGELETIFDKFTQSSQNHEGAGGTGLGLPICRQIIAAHQGHLWAENKPRGGAVFAFEIPLARR